MSNNTIQIIKHNIAFTKDVLRTINDYCNWDIPYHILVNFKKIKRGIYIENDHYPNGNNIPFIFSHSEKKDLVCITYHNKIDHNNLISELEIQRVENAIIENKDKNTIFYFEYFGNYAISINELKSLKKLFDTFSIPLLISSNWNYGIQKLDSVYLNNNFDYLFELKNFNGIGVSKTILEKKSTE